MNILITSASRKVSLIKQFKKALNDEEGGRVIAADINFLAPALYFADEYCLLPKSDTPAFIETVLRLCEQREIKLIVPTRDEELSIFAINRERFHRCGTIVMTCEPDTITICQDKLKFADFCRDNGFKSPKVIDPVDAQKAIYPLYVKPRFGKGSKGTWIVRSYEDLGFCLRNSDIPIIQEYIDATEFSIDLFADFDGKIISVVPRQRISVFAGESFITKTTLNPRIVEEVRRLAEALHLIGHNIIQCFFDGMAVTFIEVNPRFGGASNCSFIAGAPSPLFLVKLIRGQPLVPLRDLKDNLVMLRYTEDYFFEADT